MTDPTLIAAREAGEVVHWIGRNPDSTGHATACGKEQVYPMRGNGWRVRDITCPDCDRAICDYLHSGSLVRDAIGGGR